MKITSPMTRLTIMAVVMMVISSGCGFLSKPPQTVYHYELQADISQLKSPKELGDDVEILKKRIDISGMSLNGEPKIDYTKGSITIDCIANKGAKITDVQHILTTGGKLEFWNTYENSELISDLIEADRALGPYLIEHRSLDASAQAKDADNANFLGIPDTVQKKMTKAQIDSGLLQPILKILIPLYNQTSGIFPGPVIGMCFGKDTAQVNRYMGMDIVRAKFPKDVKFIWGAKPSNMSNKAITYDLYAIKTNPAHPGPVMDGSVFTKVFQAYDASGTPDIELNMTAQGAAVWERMTDEAANSSMMSTDHSVPVHRCIAIVIDDRVFSAPRVMGKISGGKTQITGLADINDAKGLAAILQTGPLRARLTVQKAVDASADASAK